MAVTHYLYGPSLKNVGANNVDLEATTFTVHLMTSDHAYSKNNEYWATVSANETTGQPDYEAKDLAGQALGYSAGITTLTASSETEFCSSGSIKAFHAVLAASSYLISSIDFGGAEESVDGEFKITWTDNKILTMTVSTS